MRLTNEELDKVKRKYGVEELYSWSKISTFMTSHYEYYLKYVLHKKEDIDNCAYAPMGSICHSIIEKLYGNEIQYDDMDEEFEDGWTTAIDVADLKFDRNSEEKNESIKAKYKENLKHFFKNHNKIETKVELERFLAAKIGDYVLQGYADAITKDKESCFNIIDWKTSSQYKGKVLEEHSGQLTVYAIALMQMGIPLEKIKIGFNFLKYVSIQYEQANGAIKTRDVERCKIGESLQSNCKMWLKKFGYDPDEYLMLLLDTNSISCLPEEVQEKFVISDCYVYIPLTQELVDKWTNTIITTIKDIKEREADYNECGSEKCFWDSIESVKEQSYYFATLSGYSPNLNKPYKEYLEKLESSKNGSDLFENVGSNLDDNVSITNKDICKTNNKDNVDLSWLDKII
jgi:RecB family exonuclease